MSDERKGGELTTPWDAKDAALTRARDQFAFYEQQHKAKGTPEADEKAEVNRLLVLDMQAAIDDQPFIVHDEKVNLYDEEGVDGTEFPMLSYRFQVVEVLDVRHVFISACSVAGKQRDHHVEMVLRCQADMVTKGLHIRNLDDVPDFMGDIERFHQYFGLEYQGKPRMLPEGLFDFRNKFHIEETTEYADEQPKLAEAVKRQDDRDVTNSLELQLDALVDSVFVVLGTAYLQFGSKIFNAAWKRVYDANMKKVRAEADGDARSKRDTKFDVVKPDGWVAPDHRDLVADHAHKMYRKGSEDLNPDYGTTRDTQVVPPTAAARTE